MSVKAENIFDLHTKTNLAHESISIMQPLTTSNQLQKGQMITAVCRKMIIFDYRHHNRKSDYIAHEAHTDRCDTAAVL